MYETNNFDLSKPIQGPGNPKSYGQITCDRIGKKEVHTSLTLVVAYTCNGTNPIDNMNITYDVLNKTAKQVNLNCINGTFVDA
jgi:hypothetical protein